MTAQDTWNVTFARKPLRVNALPVVAMGNVTRAAVTVPIVVCVMDTVIEIVSIAMMANAVFVMVSRFVRHAAVMEKSVMNAMMERVLPAALSPDNRQVRTIIQMETMVKPHKRPRAMIPGFLRAIPAVRLAMANR